MRTLLALATLAGVLAGCGGAFKAPDLFIVQRSGSIPGASLTLVVNEEGGVTCNASAAQKPTRKLSDAQLIEARAIQEEISEQVSAHTALAPRPGSVLSYTLRDESGSVRFADNSAGQPKVFRKLALFVLQVAQKVCGLPM